MVLDIDGTGKCQHAKTRSEGVVNHHLSEERRGIDWSKLDCYGFGLDRNMYNFRNLQI